MRLVTLTTEEEGIGIATGCWLGGGRAMIAMQSSGVGNCINALGLPLAFRAPCLMLVTMRGQWGEFNPWQVPMGQGTRPALEAVGVKCYPVDKPEEVGETFAAAADIAFNSRVSAAVLVSQRIIGIRLGPAAAANARRAGEVLEGAVTPDVGSGHRGPSVPASRGARRRASSR